MNKYTNMLFCTFGINSRLELWKYPKITSFLYVGTLLKYLKKIGLYKCEKYDKQWTFGFNYMNYNVLIIKKIDKILYNIT